MLVKILERLRIDTYEAAWGMLAAAYAAVKRHARGGTKLEMWKQNLPHGHHPGCPGCCMLL
jgi:hypothetical protein